MPKRTDISKILVLGSGPIVIGQSAEFDYSGTQACKALKSEGYEVVLANSNPATIMTDPESADRTYIEPLSRSNISKEIIRIEREKSAPTGIAVQPTVGGQTALNLAIRTFRWRRPGKIQCNPDWRERCRHQEGRRPALLQRRDAEDRA